MATAIKAIPTLYGKEARRFRDMADEDLYTKPPKDEADRADRRQHPRRLRTRLMFCDLLEE